MVQLQNGKQGIETVNQRIDYDDLGVILMHENLIVKPQPDAIYDDYTLDDVHRAVFSKKYSNFNVKVSLI